MWFAFALASTLFGGLQSFFQKIAAEKKYDTYLISAISSLISALGGFIALAFIPGGFSAPVAFYGLALISGILFIAISVTRLESLQYIDAAIFFPIYKVIGPALVALIGIFLFREQLALWEIIGIVLSCFVPLLLITKHEHHRQKNLKLGVFFLLGSTVFSAIVWGVNGIVVKMDAGLVLPLSIVANGCAFLVGIILFAHRHRKDGVRAAALSRMHGSFWLLALAIGAMQMLSFIFLLLAISMDNLSLAYSVNAHYILIPVLLSVWLYKEHWNKQKALALLLSMLALALLHH